MNKKLVSLLLVVFLVFGSMVALATGGDDGQLKLYIPSTDAKAMGEVFETLKGTFEASFKLEPGTTSKYESIDLITYTGDTELRFNLGAFDGATSRSKTLAFRTFIDVLGDSSVSLNTQQNLFNVLTDYSPSVNVVLTTVLFNRSGADLYTASIWARPFMQGVQPVIGLGVIFILSWLIISSIADIVWLGMGQYPEDNKKPKYVSADAFAVMKESMDSLSQGKYKGVYGAYLVKRSMTYIIVGIVVLTLLVAEIGGLLGKILGLVGGVLQ